MKSFTANVLKVFVYYLLLFALCRFVFLLYNFKEVSAEGTFVIFSSLFHALPLDISAACYLLFVPLLLLWVQHLVKLKAVWILLRGYIIATSVVIILLGVSEIAIYREVHVKLYYGLLSHLKHPAELIHSVSIPLLAIVFALMGLLLYVGVVLTNKLFPANTVPTPVGNWTGRGLLFLAFIAFGSLTAIGCRGGLQPIPINEGEVYFSTNQCINDGTVNPLWNILHSYIESRKIEHGNVYKTMDDSEAQAIVNALYSVQQDTTVRILKANRPNICFLILESWSAEVVESLGGYKDLTPNFEKLVKDGYLYTHISATGHVSDQGIPGILSGYPALPFGSAINQAEKGNSLPTINNKLKEQGYYSTFFFGGQLIYGNIKSYIYHSRFDKVVEQQSLPANIPAGRLGIHDSIMLDIWGNDLSTMKEPFFSCLFTLSSHSPFDVPMPNNITWGDMENPYLNSIVYADKQIGHFFAEAKKQPWYNNTIFVLVADHSHNVPKNYRYDTPQYYHIPLLMVGGALKDEYRGEKNDKMGSQLDIATTLLKQMDLNADAFTWSRNLQNVNTKEFAFYTFNEGFGYVEADAHVIWNKKYVGFSTNTAQTPERKAELQHKGEAMLQVVVNDFLKR